MQRGEEETKGLAKRAIAEGLDVTQMEGEGHVYAGSRSRDSRVEKPTATWPDWCEGSVPAFVSARLSIWADSSSLMGSGTGPEGRALSPGPRTPLPAGGQ